MDLIERVMPQVTYADGFNKKVDLLEREFLKHEQVDCPVVHRFGPGIYIREVTVPAGALVIGHAQKHEHLNVFLKGRVTVINEDGTHTELVAPMTFVGKPGRKVGYVHEDMVWQNVYATEETDIAKLESMFLDKSDGWQAHQASLPRLAFDADRSDYRKVLEEFGFTEEIARAQSESEADQIPFRYGSYKVAVSDSMIEGKGLFATAQIQPFEVIAPARIGGMRTPAGRYTNHSAKPNARMVMREDGDIDLICISMSGIRGCAGGNFGEEITIDYRDALRLQIKGK